MLDLRQTPYFDYYKDARSLGRITRRPRKLSPLILEDHGFYEQISEDDVLLLAFELEDRVANLEKRMSNLCGSGAGTGRDLNFEEQANGS